METEITQGPLKFIAVIDGRLEAVLDFGSMGDGAEETYLQLLRFLEIYDPCEVNTLISLGAWARTRKIPYSIKVRGFFNLESLLLRLLIALNDFLEKQGMRGISPKRWKE